MLKRQGNTFMIYQNVKNENTQHQFSNNFKIFKSDTKRNKSYKLFGNKHFHLQFFFYNRSPVLINIAFPVSIFL